MKSDVRNDRFWQYKLKVFMIYVNNLEAYWNDYITVEEELYDNKSSSIIYITPGRKNRKGENSEIVDRVLTRDIYYSKYIEAETYIYEVSKCLNKLNDDELNLLYLRFERQLTLREIGDEIYCSYMQVSRLLDKIYTKLNSDKILD